MALKLDLFSWIEVKPREKFKVPAGRLQVRVTRPAPLFVFSQGCTCLAGVASSFDVELSDASEALIDAPENARVFIYEADKTACEPDGEVFTNIDQMPDEGGPVSELRRAARQLELQRRELMAEMRSEHARFMAEREAVTSLVEASDDVIEPTEQGGEDASDQ